MPLRADLFAAYRKAQYVVFDPGILFNIGRPSPALDELLARHGARGAAFITAANPCGEAVDAQANLRATERLRAQVCSMGFACYPGEGRDPQGHWVVEPSLLVVGIARAEAEALGRAWEQNAIVFIEPGQAPELAVLCE